MQASGTRPWWPTLLWIFAFLAVGVPIGIYVLSILIAEAAQNARRPSSGNNLKQIALAMHNYHDVHGQFPRAYWIDPSGKRTLSWRVALLPELEERDLFAQIQADRQSGASEPSLAKKYRTPRCYRIPDETSYEPRDTSYMVITGPGTLFEEGRDIGIAACTDGLANTILAVEVYDGGVPWTEPQDLDIRTMVMKINGGGAKGIRGLTSKGASVVFADGSVKFLPNSTLEANLRAMITRSGDELINPDGVTPPKILTGQ